MQGKKDEIKEGGILEAANFSGELSRLVT